jgi:hypothetical protein
MNLIARGKLIPFDRPRTTNPYVPAPIKDRRSTLRQVSDGFVGQD